jgi:hypothetical protein
MAVDGDVDGAAYTHRAKRRAPPQHATAAAQSHGQEHSYRLCFVRGPEGFIIGLPEPSRKAALRQSGRHDAPT